MKNEKGNAGNVTSIKNLKPKLTMIQNTSNTNKFQIKSATFCFAGLSLVCDECAVPLNLYGENFFESYCNGRANILKCLCDLHAAELEVCK